MLQSVLKNFIKIVLPSDFTIDKVEKTAHQEIRNGHKVYDTIVHTLCLTVVCFTL